VVRRISARSSLLEILLTEGRNREIRRMMARVGHKVLQLTRIAFGSVRLGELPAGEYRELTPVEVRSLREGPTLVRPLRAKTVVDRSTRPERAGKSSPRKAAGGKGSASGSKRRSTSGKTPTGTVIGGSSSRRSGRAAPRKR